MSEIKVNKISPKQTCTQLTLGDSGDTIIIPAGATIQNSGTATGFGPTGAVSWDTTPKTTTVTATSGVGYFINTTSGGVTVNLPAGSAGSIVALADYAATWNTNAVTVNANGSEKIGGTAAPATLNTQGKSVTFIYVDSTEGWINVGDATAVIGNAFVAATGGTITTCGDYKIHTFTGPGTFTVTNAGIPSGSNSVDYLVVAGGGSGGSYNGAGGGAGGFRESVPSPAAWTASPLANPGGALPVSVQGYPITVGGGGSPITSCATRGNPGNPSVFSTITSTAGGGGGSNGGQKAGGSGGSGGGSTDNGPAGGSGNTPPTSPSQGNNGGSSSTPSSGGGGGGAGAAGTPATIPCRGANGGNGVATSISASPVLYTGGGGGGGRPGASPITPQGGTGGGGNGSNTNTGAVAGTTNTGGGGGAGGGVSVPSVSGAGGSGIVIIRYKFQ